MEFNSIRVMQTNYGFKIFGPSDDWVGPPPDNSCELYISRIPKTINEEKILEPFLRFGKVYQVRLAIDLFNKIRGYAYVRYTNKEDAKVAMEVLNHFFIEPNTTMDIVVSCENCRLFVSNVPRHLTKEDIEKEFWMIFPSMQSISFKGSSGTSSGHMGYVFLNFATHDDATEAKDSCLGILRLWHQDLKVVWANTEGVQNEDTNKTIFVRNVDLKLNNRDLLEQIVKFVPRNVVRKISKNRTNVFVDFTSRQAAETILDRMQGIKLGETKFAIEWAKPSEQQSLHRMRNIDYDNLLRMKCIANMWRIPVIIFGTYFEREGIQYAAVLLRNSDFGLRFIICILQSQELVDIHSRLCEVVVELINKIGGFPDYNYVLFVQKDIAHMLGVMLTYPHIDFVASRGVPKKYKIDVIEVFELSYACFVLTRFPEEELLQAYKDSFSPHILYTYLWDYAFFQRIFGTIPPTYRNKPPLKYNLNSTQIVLALCYRMTGSNSSYFGRSYTPIEVSRFDYGLTALPYTELPLLPLSISQSRYASVHVLSRVVFGGVDLCHPVKPAMSPLL